MKDTKILQVEQCNIICLHTNNLFISLSGSSAVGLAVWLDVGSGGMLGWRRVGFWSQIDNKKRR